MDKFFYELASVNESRGNIPAELPICHENSFMFEDAERVLETIQDWNNICGEPVRREAVQCVLNCTELLEKEAAETIHETGSYSACEVARERMIMVVSDSLNMISENEMPICSIVGSALVEAYARLETVEKQVVL